jgi:hypothetical protein
VGLNSTTEEKYKMHPHDALSPKWRIEPGSIKVIYSNNDWALADITYDGVPRTGIRWNGDINDRNDLGYPSARGSNGAWFMLPDELTVIVKAMLSLGLTLPKNII